jgi:YbbR domain-containing protein
MINSLRGFFKILPTLVTAFILAVTVWISAVTAEDPTQEDTYPRQVPIEVIGQDPGLVLTSNIPGSLSLSLRAPQSVWVSLRNEQAPVRAVIDLSGLETGTHTVPVQVQVGVRPVEIVGYSPRSITVTMERLVSRSLPIDLVIRGVPSVGFQADEPQLSQEAVTISGPESLVNQVERVRAILDVSAAIDTIDRTIPLQAVDSSDTVVNGISLAPDQVEVTQTITQRFGYRNVVVKTVVSGEPSNGYRLTNISVFPPAVTVYSPDSLVISNLPGFVETMPIDLSNLRDDLDINVALNLPEGISVVGDENQVLVRVGIAAIESSVTLENMPIEIFGLSPDLQAQVSPETVTIILSGPVAFLDQLSRDNTRVFIDLSGAEAGTYQVSPEVEIIPRDVVVESILPTTVEVVITAATSPTSTR